ncbi:MAG: aminoacyl-histidine dipeptidase [Paludibacteraceae bacterium]|nr:aminoacyl-histidine dipeptidase [Paludibacteraceae bacterium]
MDILELQPKEVFSIFHEITKIPRPSKHEEQISAWLVDFARRHHLDYEVDEAMNVVMRAPATAGYEDHPGVILQAHMDMVCEKNNDTVHDFAVDPIQTYVDGDWLKARGTTLGGDDGIGVAMGLAALTSTTLRHPALECLFTVDEETGLTGANRLKEGCLRSKRLINLDSEDDGQIFIGCAGGIDTLGKMHYTAQKTDTTGLYAARVSVTGLMGGHSGDDINKGRGNANKVVVRFLYKLLNMNGFQLASINGGNLRNAIAREAEAVFTVCESERDLLSSRFNQYVATVESEIGEIETGMRLSIETADMPSAFIPHDQAQALIRMLYACPHGMFAMSKDMPGLVETSTNLASVKTKDEYVEINTSQRSSIESRKHEMKEMVECAMSAVCDEITHGDGYPGWKPNVHSPLLEVVKQAYIDLFKEEPKVLAIHAGLECGLFLEKYPDLDMVSVGPQMVGVHSPQERLSISSTARCWQWLCHTLESL